MLLRNIGSTRLRLPLIASSLNNFKQVFPRETATEAAAAETETSESEWSSTLNNPRRLNSPFAAKQLIHSLNLEQKRYLLTALNECAGLQPKPSKDHKALDYLIDKAKVPYPKGLKFREEVIRVLKAHKELEARERYLIANRPLNSSELLRLGIKTGIPFIGFGFLDNFIMIVAGESIEHAFGLTLGLSIMAAAALGNMLSDVAGICFAENIESATRRFFERETQKLSKIQQCMPSVRMARTLGSVIGVCIGCILGMLPLMWFDLAYTEKLPFRKD